MLEISVGVLFATLFVVAYLLGAKFCSLIGRMISLRSSESRCFGPANLFPETQKAKYALTTEQMSEHHFPATRNLSS